MSYDKRKNRSYHIIIEELRTAHANQAALIIGLIKDCMESDNEISLLKEEIADLKDTRPELNLE